ncbi:MAG TPA: hypothetical protein VHV77_02460 [Pirellulales bacterium]|jgi:hypothetical protein|nr:hypothetical protein [Pirellulales bacterium]
MTELRTTARCSQPLPKWRLFGGLALCVAAKPLVILAAVASAHGFRILYRELSSGRPVEWSLLFFAGGGIAAIMSALVIVTAYRALRS